MPYVSDSVFNNPATMTDTGDTRYPYWRPNGYDSDPDIARIQKEQDIMNAWSAQQAFENRAWQQEMSDTAHQREVADLKAAGLNPVLSANSGASTPAGAAATADSSSVSAIKDIAITQAETLSALALMQARGTGSGSGSSGYYGKTGWEKMLQDLIEGYAGTDAKSALQKAGSWLSKSGAVQNTVTAAKNIAGSVLNAVENVAGFVNNLFNKEDNKKSWWPPWKKD